MSFWYIFKVLLKYMYCFLVDEGMGEGRIQPSADEMHGLRRDEMQPAADEMHGLRRDFCVIQRSEATKNPVLEAGCHRAGDSSASLGMTG